MQGAGYRVQGTGYRVLREGSVSEAQCNLAVPQEECWTLMRPRYVVVRSRLLMHKECVDSCKIFEKWEWWRGDKGNVMDEKSFPGVFLILFVLVIQVYDVFFVCRCSAKPNCTQM